MRYWWDTCWTRDGYVLPTWIRSDFCDSAGSRDPNGLFLHYNGESCVSLSIWLRYVKIPKC